MPDFTEVGLTQAQARFIYNRAEDGKHVWVRAIGEFGLITVRWEDKEHQLQIGASTPYRTALVNRAGEEVKT